MGGSKVHTLLTWFCLIAGLSTGLGLDMPIDEIMGQPTVGVCATF